jgi:hypothetical protein
MRYESATLQLEDHAPIALADPLERKLGAASGRRRQMDEPTARRRARRLR